MGTLKWICNDLARGVEGSLVVVHMALKISANRSCQWLTPPYARARKCVAAACPGVARGMPTQDSARGSHSLWLGSRSKSLRRGCLPATAALVSHRAGLGVPQAGTFCWWAARLAGLGPRHVGRQGNAYALCVHFRDPG